MNIPFYLAKHAGNYISTALGCVSQKHGMVTSSIELFWAVDLVPRMLYMGQHQESN